MDAPWVWRDESMFGPASVGEFLNGTNTTESFVAASGRNKESTEVETLFGITTGVVLVINLLFTIKDKSSRTEEIRSKVLKASLLKWDYLLFVAVSLVLSPLTILTLASFSIYRTFVYAMLSFKYRGSFIGLLNGCDQVWAVENKSKSIITIMLVIESGKDVDVYERVLKLMGKICEDNWKFSHRRGKAFGYYFWKKGLINIDEHVRKVQLEEASLGDFIGKWSNVELPQGHETSWDVFVGTKDLKREGEKRLTPVIARIHHTIGDGVALMTMFLRALKDEEEVRVIHSQESVLRRAFKESFPTRVIFERARKLTVVFGDYLYLIFFGVGFAAHQFLIRGKDNNALHGPDLTGEKVIDWITEEDLPILNVIKRIKRRFNGVSFNDVLLTAVSSSFCDYINKKSPQGPKPSHVTVVLPLRMEPLETVTIRQLGPNGNVSRVSDNCYLTNRFSMAMFNLPMFIQNENEQELTLVERLSAVNRESRLLRNSPDIIVNYLFCSILAKLLPEGVIGHIFNTAHNTAAVSNMPGPQEMHILNGCKLNNLMFWLPNKGTTGVGVSVLSYGDRLQLGLLADKAIVDNRQDARMILKGVEDAIRDLDVVTFNCTK